MGVRISHIRDLGEELSGGDWDVVVVIDVIRAFTVAPWVLRQGARRLLLAANAEAAVSARDARFPEALLLKDGAPDPRFDLPNAPGRIALVNLSGRIVIQATGNGTRAAHEVSEAPQVLCASFVNAGATAAVLAGHERILLVPTEGDEDHALADYVAVRLERK
ncbi:MAG: 2-phosphosulfolactate phosphatase [Tetrasphaera sp.]